MKSEETTSWEIEIFYDGACPLCNREMNLLRRIDRKHRIRFTDIAGSGFVPETYGKSMSEFMDEIQGRLPGGEWIRGVEVFRRLYIAIGLKRVVWLTRLPGVSQSLELAYRVFAKNRLRLTGRCDSESCKLN